MLERELETVLYYRPDLIPALYRGVWVSRWLARQYKVPSGRIDLLGVSETESGQQAVVVEIKRGNLDERALIQVCRYAADIENVLTEIAAVNGLLTVHDSKVHKIVIGQSIDYFNFLAATGMSVQVVTYQADIFKNIRLFPYSESERDARNRIARYTQLANDSPFEYWVKQARIEINELFPKRSDGDES